MILLSTIIGISAAIVLFTIEPVSIYSQLYFILSIASLVTVVLYDYWQDSIEEIELVVPYVLTSWTFLGGLAVTGLYSINKSFAIPIYSLSIFFNGTLRSVLEIALVGAAIWGLHMIAKGLDQDSKNLFGRVAWITIVVLVALRLKLGNRVSIALWSDVVTIEVRSWLLFDLSNAVWVACALPLLISRRSGVVGEKLLRASTDRVSVIMALLVGAIPVVVALGVNSFAGVAIDTLSLAWWVKKSAALFLWTAVFEELVYRTVVVGAILGAQDTGRWREAIIVSGIVFGLVHFQAGVLQVCFTMFTGMLFAYIVIRYGAILICIFGHCLLDLIALPWNTQ